MSDRTLPSMAAMTAVVALLVAGCTSTSAAPSSVSSRSSEPTSAVAIWTIFQTVVSTVVRTETVTETVDAPDVSDLQNREFDEDEVSAGVTSILSGAPPAGYGLTGISEVRCPPDRPVTSGTSFTCSLLVDGAESTVTISVVTDDGLYEVHPPS